jgi:4-oxalocrotonate tautomerase
MQGSAMPFLNLRTTKGMLSSDQKRYLMDKFTDLLIEVEGGGNPQFRKMVWIMIEENEPQHWQLGSMHPTPESVAEFVQHREAARMK